VKSIFQQIVMLAMLMTLSIYQFIKIIGD